jgi:hypothetical protein
VVFDLDLATDYGGRGEDTGGTVTGRFHVGAIAVRVSRDWRDVADVLGYEPALVLQGR